MLQWTEIEETLGKFPHALKQVLLDFESVKPDELPKKLPRKRAIDHEIELIPGVKPLARALYWMSQPELVELRKQLSELLELGLVEPVKNSFGSAVLFQKETDGSCRM